MCRCRLSVAPPTLCASPAATLQIQLLARRRTDVAPPDPDTPRMLPSVHLAWAPLMGALQVRKLHQHKSCGMVHNAVESWQSADIDFKFFPLMSCQSSY